MMEFWGRVFKEGSVWQWIYMLLWY